MTTFASHILALYERCPEARGLSVRELAILCLIARAERKLTPTEVAQAMVLRYHNAWSGLRRLALAGLLEDGELTARARAALGVVEPAPIARQASPTEAEHLY